jgi:hypothetical protein
MGTPQTRSGSADRAAFPTTHWSVVLAAGRERSPQGDAALETLAQAYWYPIYAFLRRESTLQPKDSRSSSLACSKRTILGAGYREKGCLILPGRPQAFSVRGNTRRTQTWRRVRRPFIDEEVSEGR